MEKIVFVITSGEEAEMVQTLCSELDKKAEVVNIVTDLICCDKETKRPIESMDKLGMPRKSWSVYKTSSIVKMLRQEKPDVVIVGSDQEYIRRAFMYAAEGIGAETVLLDLGIADNVTNTTSIALKRTVYRLSKHFLNIFKKYLYLLRVALDLKWNPFKIIKMILHDVQIALTIDDARGRYGCKHIVVSGTWGREILIERGVNPEHIFVTGHPRFGLQLKDGSGEYLRTELGIGEGRIILFLMGSYVEHGRWSVDMRDKFVREAVDVIQPILSVGCKLLISVHPVTNLEEYRKLINHNENIILCRGVSLEDMINQSSLVIVSGYSTTVLEASALNKPVILLNTFGEIEGIPYSKMGLAVEVNRFAELENTIIDLMYSDDKREELLSRAKRFFETNQEYVDGKATQRITDLILKLAKNE